MQYNNAMVAESIFRSPRSVGNTLKKLSVDKEFEASRPNTHKVISSLAQSYDVRGRLTDNQKQLAAKLITQQLPYLTAKANARAVAHVVAPVSEETAPIEEREPGDESEQEIEQEESEYPF